MAKEPLNVIVGVDTHADTHHVAIITEYGKPLADQEFLAVGQIFNPMPAPSIVDLRQKRRHLGFTINAAAGHLSQWPSVISRLERGLIHNDTLSTNYRQWLQAQAAQRTD
ncbi:hypothetical protein ACX80Z_13755 [Arthrobacter sp. TMT4-20]